MYQNVNPVRTTCAGRVTESGIGHQKALSEIEHIVFSGECDWFPVTGLRTVVNRASSSMMVNIYYLSVTVS